MCAQEDPASYTLYSTITSERIKDKISELIKTMHEHAYSQQHQMKDEMTYEDILEGGILRSGPTKIVAVGFGAEQATLGLIASRYPTTAADGVLWGVAAGTLLKDPTSDVYACLLYTSPSPRD